MSDITKIEKIHTSAGDHEIDARYWGGNETLKTINGESLFGSGDISIPDEVELIEISGDMLANEPTYTATEALAILEAYYANKLIVLNNPGTTNYSLGWFIPNIFIRSTSTNRQVYISGILANFYIEQRFVCDATSGSVSGVHVDKKIDLTEIGGSSEGGSSMYAYGTCSTASGTATKTVTLTDSNFTVSTGSIVAVKFTYANSVATTLLKLSVGDVTAQIKYLNTTFLSNQHWSAGSVVEFIYDGSAWQVLGTIKDNVGSDTKVNQTITTTNSTYPLLFSATANKSTSSADAARFSTSFKYNPSTDTLTVGNITGTANNANTLNTSNTINGVKYTGAADVSNYVVCTNEGSTFAKTVTHPNFKLVTGARVSVKFTNRQQLSALDAITLKVGDTTAKGMYYKGEAITGANITFEPGLIYDFIYDGNSDYWVLQGEWDVYSTAPITHGAINGITYDGISDIKFLGTCSSNSTTSAKVVELVGYTPTAGTKIFITFEKGSTLPNTSTTTANMFINVNGSGNKEVYFEGQKNIPYLSANEIYEFMYDGTRFNLVNMSNPTFTYNTGVAPVFEMSTAVPNALHLIGPSTGCRVVTINNSGTMVANKSYNFEFTLLSRPGNIALPTEWKWVNGTYPVFEGGKTYQISVMNNCAVCASFSSAEPS